MEAGPPDDDSDDREPFGAIHDEDEADWDATDDADWTMPGDPEEPEEPEPHTALPPRIEAWRQRSATGAILTGFALGLQQALEQKRDEQGIVVQTSGDPPTDLPVEADFEYGRPRQSVVNIRPWLLDGPDAEVLGLTDDLDTLDTLDDLDALDSIDEEVDGPESDDGRPKPR